jgi:hypothetical protein
MTPELLAMIKDVPAATDEKLEMWRLIQRDPYRAIILSLIARIVEERRVVKDALEPFAKEADNWDGDQYTADETEDGKPIPFPDDTPAFDYGTELTVGDLRRARAASSNREGGEPVDNGDGQP